MKRPSKQTKPKVGQGKVPAKVMGSQGTPAPIPESYSKPRPTKTKKFPQ